MLKTFKRERNKNTITLFGCKLCSFLMILILLLWAGVLMHHDGALATSTPTVGHVGHHPPTSLARSGSYVFSDCGSARLFSDATSVRSLASIGMGSTDGRKMVIRRVPNSPTELLTILNPPM